MNTRGTPREEALPIKRKDREDPGESKQSSLRAISRTAEILRCLQRRVMTVTEIANELGIHKSTSHRILQALEEAGLVIRNKLNRRYYIGPLVAGLVSDPDVTHEHLVSCAVKPMKYLAKVTEESIGLNILIGLHNVLLHEIPSTHDLHIVAKKKVASDLYAGAHGKVLLSQLKPKELRIALNNMDFNPLTERTITHREELLVQLDRIREQGYAVSYGERIPDVINFAVPIRNYFIPVALGILSPENRVKSRISEFLEAIREAGVQIERNIAEAFQ